MTLVLIDDDGAQVVRRVPAGEARREHALRDLIHDYPSMLPVHDLDPSFGRVFTVAKEFTIPGVGFVDVLLADERGRLIVVECKLWRNPQARREVIGQILDYARELARFGYEDLQRQVAIATGMPGNTLYRLACAAGSDLDESRFVDRVSRDLAAGRFLLLVVGDGITEGTQRIGEYLRDQPGLAFDFGLVELAEYRLRHSDGSEHVVVQPRLLAQTRTIDRHVIRSEIPGLIVELAETARPAVAGDHRPPSDAAIGWRAYVDALIADLRFDDPGQPPPRMGGIGWIKVPLPRGLYINLYRSSSEGALGAQVRFPDAEDLYLALADDRMQIDCEIAATGLPPLVWRDDAVPSIGLTMPALEPWSASVENAQRNWLGRAANQLVNSLRPRLQRETG